jgi:hypothetical protein
MSDSDTAAPIHIPDDELVAWLDGLTKTERAGVMLAEHAFAKVADRWDELTPAEKVKLYNSEPAPRAGFGADISDYKGTLHVETLMASDYEPERPDHAAIDNEETSGINFDHPHVIEMANQRAARTVFELVDWLFSYGAKEHASLNLHRRLDSADTKLVSLAWLLGVREFGAIPLTKLAAELGLTRAALSHSALQVRDKWRIFQRGQRSESARDIYRDRQKAIWRKRPRQASGTLIKNSKQRESIAAFLEANPDATTADIRAELGGSHRTVERILAAYSANRTPPRPDATPVADVASAQHRSDDFRDVPRRDV